MTQPLPIANIFRFGPFEFRPNQWELRKSGTILKLQPQSARLLLLLVTNPGETVTREQIQQTVWGGDVTVDYDLGVNRCIRQIRSVLLDNPDSPRYIKTIPRQGYCFIAPVERVASPIRPVPAVVLPDAAPAPAPVQATIAPASPKAKWQFGATLQTTGLLIASGLIAIGIWQYLVVPPAAPRIDGYSQLTSDAYNKVIKTSDFARPIFTDGDRLYFSVLTGAARSVIAQVAESGGETSLLPGSLTSPILLDLSQRRSEMLLASGPGIADLPLWIQPLPAGSARRVPDVSAHGASWSPDGESIAYASENSLYLASGPEIKPKLLAVFDSGKRQQAYWLRWSADGRRIRFSLVDGSRHSSSLWEIAAAGGTPHQLFPEGGPNQDSCCGTWTPDGQSYVLASSVGDRSDIWELPAQVDLFARLRRATKPVQLTAGPLSYSAPTFSRDGKRIFVIGNATRGELVRYDSKSHDLVPLAPGIPAVQADYSRDGKWLAFVSADGSLWRTRPDGTESIQLSFPPLHAALPRWSPDGSSIVFYGHPPGELNSVYLTPSAGGAPHKLISEKDGDERDPDWSADGKKLVFWEAPVNRQTSTIRVLDIQSGRSSPLAPGHPLRSPRWSPDGRYISALNKDLNALLLYDIAAKTWTPLANFRLGYPNWSRDSKYIYVVNLANGAGVSRIRISDHTVQPVLNMAGRNQYWTADAWLGLTRDDAPLLSRDISIQQVFALHLVAK